MDSPRSEGLLIPRCSGSVVGRSIENGSLFDRSPCHRYQAWSESELVTKAEQGVDDNPTKEPEEKKESDRGEIEAADGWNDPA